MAIVANVLNSDVFKSDGSKSSTKSLRVDFNSKQNVLFFSFNSIADLELEYLIFNSFIALLIEFKSELVISERSLRDIGLPFKYKTASILVTRAILENCLVMISVWLIFNTEFLFNLPYI